MKKSICMIFVCITSSALSADVSTTKNICEAYAYTTCAEERSKYGDNCSTGTGLNSDTSTYEYDTGCFEYTTGINAGTNRDGESCAADLDSATGSTTHVIIKSAIRTKKCTRISHCKYKVSNPCEKTYKCASRYYGKPTSLTSTACTLCPSYGGETGFIESNGIRETTENCYVRSNYELSSTPGKYVFTSECYYR